MLLSGDFRSMKVSQHSRRLRGRYTVGQVHGDIVSSKSVSTFKMDETVVESSTSTSASA